MTSTYTFEQLVDMFLSFTYNARQWAECVLNNDNNARSTSMVRGNRRGFVSMYTSGGHGEVIFHDLYDRRHFEILCEF